MSEPRDRVLVVDDSLTVRMDLGEAFEDAGIEARLVATIAEARAVLAGPLPSLVVLDVVLPDGDGVELLSELRSSPATASLPVLMLSGEAEVSDRIRGLTHGADAYVGKPYDRDYITSRATDILRRGRERAHDRTSVLLVDDSPTFRQALSEELVRAGYDVATAASGEEGLRKAAALRPDAIIVDGIMPGIDGPAVVRSVRLDAGLAATPCLLLTGSDGAALEVAALDAGADAYARKSDAHELVLARLSAMLRSANESRARGARAETLLGPKRILAVDDSPTYLAALEDELRADGYEVVRATSGEEALRLLGLEPFDCVLLDRMMPGMSGTEACRRIKEAPSLRRVPLIMLTALDGHGAMIEGVNAGADDYVTKDAGFEILKARLRAQLRRKQFEDEHRRVRDALMRKDAEAEAARQAAEARQVMADALARKNEVLARHTADLERLNRELESFAYSVSHDLRQPLRSMHGFSQILLERHREGLDPKAIHYLERIASGAHRMGELIDGLLSLSRITRAPLALREVRLDHLARRVVARLADGDPQRVVTVDVSDGLVAQGDPKLVESLLENLLGNAWKFTSRRPDGHITLGARDEGSERVFVVADNGAGFDMAYASRLFAPFTRMHTPAEFEGSGIGLATAQRIVHRHGGRIWARGEIDRGATFMFTLAPPEVVGAGSRSRVVARPVVDPSRTSEEGP